MLYTREEIVEYIRKVAVSDFRGGFVPLGELRATARRAGSHLDAEHDEHLSSEYDLTSYSYALLDLGLRLYEMDSESEEYLKAFEFSANSMEASLAEDVQGKGDRKFDLIVAASAYHLARFSACSYTLLMLLQNSENLDIMEKILVNLMLRDISSMKGTALSYRVSKEGTDTKILDAIKDWASSDEINDESIEENFLIDCIDRSLVDKYCSAISVFILGVERGEPDLVAKALYTLKGGLDVCSEWNFIERWWMYRISIYLIKDLWKNTYHYLLDPSLDKDDSEWKKLRQIFIAGLYRRPKSEIDLWPSQIDAARRSADQDDDLVVSLPTSSGKTRIAELCILRCLSKNRRAIFVVPLRTLAAQIEETLKDTFCKAGISVSSYYDSGGFSEIDTVAFRAHDILVMTPEKLDFLVRYEQTALDDVGLLVFDEGHMLQLDERGVRYEALVQRLLRRPDAQSRRIVCLSAVLPDGNGIDDFVSWIRRDKKGRPVEAKWRPTKLRFGKVVWKGTDADLTIHSDGKTYRARKYIPGFVPPSYISPKRKRRAKFPNNQRELCVATAWKLASCGQTALIFCPQKNSVEPFATSIIDLYERDAIGTVLRGSALELENAIAIGNEWFGNDSDIIKCLNIGVGLHHAAMPRSYQREIERLISKRILGVVVSSPTLAQGVNLPITSVIMFSVSRYNGRGSSPPIDFSEFRNIVGRAGRSYVSNEGLVLYPMFDGFKARERNWDSLVGEHTSEVLTSCLVGLVRYLRDQIRDITSRDLFEDNDHSSTYDWNNIEHAAGRLEDADKVKDWKKHVAMLDSVILTLIGDSEVKIEGVDIALTEMLECSLWGKFFQHSLEDDESEFQTVISSRGRYLWSKSTESQRQGYYLAGVGLEDGNQLDSIDVFARKSIDASWNHILNNENDKAVCSLLDFARLIFDIPTFRPKSKPSNWEDILNAWFCGRPVYEVYSKNRSDMVEFIEEGVVYKLAWAVDIIGEREIRDMETEDEGELFSAQRKFEIIGNFIKAGTLSVPASILILSGFDSRLAAISAVTNTNASFVNREQLVEWLGSDSISERKHDSSWPTYETHTMWSMFVNRVFSHAYPLWVKSDWTVEVDWHDEMPMSEIPLQIYDYEGSALVLSETGEAIGVLNGSVNPTRTGLTIANSIPNSCEVNITYIGPMDFWIYSWMRTSNT